MDPIKNIQIPLPGFEKTYKIFPFHPLFLERMKFFKTVRFMQWTNEYTNEPIFWNNRTTIFSQNQRDKTGVSIEYQIKLCNILKCDPWFVLPYSATDDYITQMSILVKNTLRKDVKIYVK
jgi:hypothetical protein